MVRRGREEEGKSENQRIKGPDGRKGTDVGKRRLRDR